MRIECWLEEELVTRAKPQGIQFVLRNGFDWSEKVDVNVDGRTEHGGTVGIVDATKLTDEELLARIEALNEKVGKIRAREGGGLC